MCVVVVPIVQFVLSVDSLASFTLDEWTKSDGNCSSTTDCEVFVSELWLSILSMAYTDGCSVFYFKKKYFFFSINFSNGKYFTQQSISLKKSTNLSYNNNNNRPCCLLQQTQLIPTCAVQLNLYNFFFYCHLRLLIRFYARLRFMCYII